MADTHYNQIVEDEIFLRDADLSVLAVAAPKRSARREVRSAYLTDVLVQALQPELKEYSVRDTVEALSVRVTPTGGKNFYVSYHGPQSNERRRERIGRVSDYSAEEARAIARRSTETADRDGIPFRTERIRLSRATPMRAAFSRYCETHFGDRSQRWQRSIQSLAEHHVFPTMGDTPVHKIKRSELVRLTQKVSLANRSHANTLHKGLKSFFSWCVDNGIVEVNPLWRSGLPATFARRRQRHLDVRALALVFIAAEALPQPWRSFVRLMILTGCPASWLQLAKLSDVYWEERLLIVSAKGETKRIPLSASSLEELAPFKSKTGVFLQSTRRKKLGLRDEPMHLRASVVVRLQRLSGHSDVTWPSIERSVQSALRKVSAGTGDRPSAEGLDAWAIALMKVVEDETCEVVI